MRLAALLAIVAFAFMLLAPTLHADTAACMIAQTRSYMDVILDERHNTSEILVYNLSKNYRKTGIDKALVYRADLSNLSDINVCFEVADDGSGGTKGIAKFKYDPNVDGCIDYWFIFCPQYSGGVTGQPTIADQQTCLNGTSLRLSAGSLIDNPILRCSPAQNSLAPIAHPEYFPSHNELYICNQRPKDYAPLCWPLMLIFALLVGANYAVGKNPFQAFDFSSPRMNRGRQYTARVQQKSFDAIGYLMAVDKAVETAGKAYGRISGTSKDVVVDAEGNEVGEVGKKANANGTKDVMKDGQKIGTVDAKGNYTASDKKSQPASANVVTRDPQWKGPTGLLTGFVGGVMTGGLLKVADWVSTGQKHDGKAITGEDGKTIGTVNAKGQIVDGQGAVIGAVSWSGKITLASGASADGVKLSVGVIGQEVVNAKNEVIGRVYADSTVRDLEGKVIGKVENGELKGAALEGARRQQMELKIDVKGKVSSGNVSKDSPDKTGGTQASGQQRYQQSIPSSGAGAIYTAATVTNIGNVFSDKPGVFSEEDKGRIKAMGHISPEQKAAMGWDDMTQKEQYRAQAWQSLKDTASFIWDKLKKEVGLDFGKDGWVLSLLKIYSTLTFLSTYTRGLGAATGSKSMKGGISFIENFNNKNKLFSFPGSDVSYGTFASYIDPSFSGGAGLPYGLAGLQPIIETAAQAGKAGISATENLIRGGARAPDADYVTGYSGGYGMDFVAASDRSYIVLDEATGKQLSKQEVIRRLNSRISTGDTNAEKLLVLVKGGGADTNTIAENFRLAGLDAFTGKIGPGGGVEKISQGEYEGGLDAQLRYTETRNQTYGFLLKYMDNPKLDSDDIKTNGTYSKEIVEKNLLSIGSMMDLLDNYGSLDERQRKQFTDALEQYKGSGLIGGYDLKSSRGKTELMGDLKDVQMSTGKYRTAQDWNLVYMQATNSKRQMDSLDYIIKAMGKGASAESLQGELANYRSYQEAELAARRAYQLSLDLGAAGAVSKALQEITLQTQVQSLNEEMKKVAREKGKDSEEYADLAEKKEKLESQTVGERIKLKETEIASLISAGKESTAAYAVAEVELEKLKKTQQLYEIFRDGKADAGTINKIESQGEVIFKNVYQQASVFDSFASAMYETAQKGLPREEMCAMITSASETMGRLSMSDSGTDGSLYKLSRAIGGVAAQIGGVDDNAWRRMDEAEREKIIGAIKLLANETGDYAKEIGRPVSSEELGMARTELNRAEQQYQETLSAFAMKEGKGRGTAYHRMPDEEVDRAEFELDRARKEHDRAAHEATVESTAPEAAASVSMNIARLNVIAAIMETRNYEGGGVNREEAIDGLRTGIDDAIGKASAMPAFDQIMTLQQKEAIVNEAAGFEHFVSQLTSLEKGLHQTSDFFVKEMVRGNLGQARFGGDYLGAGEQKFLESVDIYKQETRWRPRMAGLFGETEAEYLYKNTKWSVPEWNPGVIPTDERAAPEPKQPEIAAAAMQLREYIPTLSPRQEELDNFVSDASKRMVGYLTSDPNKNKPVVMSVSVPKEHWNREKFNEKLESTLIKETKEGIREELAKEGYSKSEIDDMMKRVTIGAVENPVMTFPILSGRVDENNWPGIQQQFVNTQYADEKDKGSKAYKAAVFSEDGDLLSKELSKDTFKALRSAKTYEEFKAGLEKAKKEYSEPIYFSNAPNPSVKSVYDIDRTAHIGTKDMFEQDENGNYRILEKYKPKEENK